VCGRDLPSDRVRRRPSVEGGVCSYLCGLIDQRARQYGITGRRYEEIFAGQQRRCAICRCILEFGATDRSRPMIDHDHRTGSVRGILCQRCNFGLGFFRDDPALLRQAAAYLEED
jgi:hypothetical protein